MLFKIGTNPDTFEGRRSEISSGQSCSPHNPVISWYRWPPKIWQRYIYMKIVILKPSVVIFGIYIIYAKWASLSASFSTVRRTFVMSRVPLKRAWLALFKSGFNYGLLQAEDTLHSNTISLNFEFEISNSINLWCHVMCPLLRKDQNGNHFWKEQIKTFSMVPHLSPNSS